MMEGHDNVSVNSITKNFQVVGAAKNEPNLTTTNIINKDPPVTGILDIFNDLF